MINERIELILTESTELLEKKRQIYQKMMIQRQGNSSLAQQTEVQLLKQGKKIEEKAERLEKAFETLTKRVTGPLEKVKLSQNSQQTIQISGMEATVKKLELQVSLLQKENGGLKEQLAEKETEIAKLRRQLNDRYAQNQNHSTKLSKVRMKMSLLAQKLQLCSIDQKSIKNDMRLCKDLINFQKILPVITKQQQKQASQAHQVMLLNRKLKDEQLQAKKREKQLLDVIYGGYDKLAHVTSLELLPKEKVMNNCTIFTDSLNKYLSITKFLPDSDILSDHEDLSWLMSGIKSFLPCYQPLKTKKLYSFQPLNKTNFHKYFDKKPNILILIKLVNNFIIGGFSHFAFNPKDIVTPGKGFLFNLNSRLTFYQKSEHQLPVTQYDDYYLALGNAELRIKSLELKFFSNFGNGNGIFDSQGKKRIDFMGCEESEIDIDSYEVYQILQ